LTFLSENPHRLKALPTQLNTQNQMETVIVRTVCQWDNRAP
jgi:hypothetical protein